jgi:cytochrome c551
MRVPALSMLLIALALVASACGGGPDDGAKRLSEACKRQMAEVAEDEGTTPTAKSSKDAQDDETLVECAGQKVKVVAADAEGEDANKDSGKDTGEQEDVGSGGDEAKPAELDPKARDLFASTCGGCHTLSDAETTGSVGPNLDDTTLDAEGIRTQIENGGGGMPPKLLEGEDADSVATYVAGAAAAG